MTLRSLQKPEQWPLSRKQHPRGPKGNEEARSGPGGQHLSPTATWKTVHQSPMLFVSAPIPLLRGGTRAFTWSCIPSPTHLLLLRQDLAKSPKLGSELESSCLSFPEC